MLLQREYNPKIIQSAFDKIMGISRLDALKRVVKIRTTKKLTFVTTFDPRRPSVSKIVRKHFDYMKSTDPYLNRVFADGVQIAYKRYRNIREILCRARLFPTPQHDARPKRVQVGFTKCGKCTTCNYAQNVKSFKVVFISRLQFLIL